MTHSVKLSIKHRKTGEFLARNSLLTDLFQISHIACVRNSLIAALFLMVLYRMVFDLIYFGRFNWTLELFHHTVGQLHVVIFVWILMTFSTSCLVFLAVSVWKHYRPRIGISLKLFDSIAVMIYSFYLMLLLILPCWPIFRYQLPLVSSSIILGEQVRQLMKTHSFVRENVHKFHSQKDSSSDSLFPLNWNDFSSYLYFLCAPTLLYRDDYPRTATINWHRAANMFGQFVVLLVLLYHIIAYYWMSVFQRILSTKIITAESAFTAIYDLMIPSVLIIILAFYAFFHCWLNGFAELLRFADRMFYEDWWNFTSAATFWRSWNVVVHDWLYVYIYQDLSKALKLSRNLSTIAVVIVSAIFHEYFIIIVFGFASPIVIFWFALFGILFRFAFPRAHGTLWNIVLLIFVPISAAVIPYLYVMEISLRNYSNNQNRSQDDL